MAGAMVAAQEMGWSDLQAQLLQSQDALTSIRQGVPQGEPAAADSVPSASENSVDETVRVVQCVVVMAKAVADLVDRQQAAVPADMDEMAERVSTASAAAGQAVRGLAARATPLALVTALPAAEAPCHGDAAVSHTTSAGKRKCSRPARRSP